MRQFRLLGVVTLVSAAAIIGLTLKFPPSGVRAQNPPASAAAPASSAISSRKIPASVVATNVNIRALAVASPTNANLASSSQSAVASLLTTTSADRQNQLFAFVNAPSATTLKAFAAAIPQGVPSFAGNAIPSNISQFAVVAGTGASGSLGDGGKSTAAQLDLNSEDLSQRSAIVIAPDGTLYIADTKNSTIRSIAGPASSEPGIVRGVAGRWAPSQNVQLSEPLGLALDRTGNLYIADHAANVIDVLYGTASAKAGILETVAQSSAPSSIAVTPDGHTLYVASADNGTVAAINLQSRAARDAGSVPASLFPAAAVKSSTVRVVPQGLATDGAGNLFVAYARTAASSSASPANLDEIVRLDAFTAKSTVAARGLSNPGEIAFNVSGDLFVSNQDAHQILKFAALGVPASGVSLTPPGGTGTSTDFGDVPVGGSTDSTALESFELSNNTSAAITNVAATTTGGNASDFTVANSSCTSTLAAGATCSFNVSFTPTQNATTSCSDPANTQQRCANLSVNYNGATAPVTAALIGTADDFQIECVSTAGVTCIPSEAGGTVQVTIAVGQAGTFQFQIVPDAFFSGPVTLVCPGDLPVTPTGSTAQPTTCGISAGTSVAEPLTPQLVIDVTAGTAAPFNVTFQTTTSTGVQFPPSTSTTGSTKRTFIISGLSSRNGGGSSGTPRSAGTASSDSRFNSKEQLLLALCACAFFLIATKSAIRAVKNARRAITRPSKLAPVYTFAALLIVAATIAGCHHYKNPSIAYTPQGTYNLTVHGSAQNASRGFTMTLVID